MLHVGNNDNLSDFETKRSKVTTRLHNMAVKSCVDKTAILTGECLLSRHCWKAPVMSVSAIGIHISCTLVNLINWRLQSYVVLHSTFDLDISFRSFTDASYGRFCHLTEESGLRWLITNYFVLAFKQTLASVICLPRLKHLTVASWW